jgi:hypothetical protein
MPQVISETSRMRSPYAVLWTREDCAKLEAAGVLDYKYGNHILDALSRSLPLSR